MIAPLAKVKRILTNNPPSEGLDAILISSVSNIAYLTNYSGFSKEEREAFLFITKNGQYIFTDGRYKEDIRKFISDFKLIEISSKNPLVRSLKNLAKKHKIKRLGFEGNNLTFMEHKTFSKYFNNIYHLSISNLRSIKTADEISAVKKACGLGDKAFDYILDKIKTGISEKQLASEIEFFIKKLGADISFPPIVAFGANSAIPHHKPTEDKLQKNSIVLLDFGAKVNNYCSDMTRTVFLGKPSKDQERIYKTVLEAQKRAIGLLIKCHSELVSESREMPKQVRHDIGIETRRIDKVARDYIISKGYPTIPHSLGHGVGIDVHEHPHLSPKSKDMLKEGMVFSIEPGIYIPRFGGVRIEDLVVLEKSCPKIITHSPRDIIEI